MEQTLDSAGAEAVVTGTLRRTEGGLARFHRSAAEAFTAGVAVSWEAAFPGTGGRFVDLPTYAFQRQRYWMDAPAETTAAGTSDHPLLDAVIDLPDDAEHGGIVGSGRLSAERHPWLADHVVHGAVLVPAAVPAELAVWAAHKAGCDTVDELTLETPLVLSRTADREIRVVVDARRRISVHSRGEGDTGWTRNAVGVAGTGGPDTGEEESLAAWPPTGAVGVPFEDEYARLSALGFTHGPLLRGLKQVWRRDDVLYAEVELPMSDGADHGAFRIHPALLHAALLPLGLGQIVDGDRPEGWLPYRCTGLRVGSTGPAALRVRLAPAGQNALSLTLADRNGTPVGGVASLTLAPADVARLTELGFDHQDSLFRLDWVPVPVPSGGDGSPYAVLGEGTLGAPLGEPGTVAAVLGREAAVFTGLAELAASGGETPPRHRRPRRGRRGRRRHARRRRADPPPRAALDAGVAHRGPVLPGAPGRRDAGRGPRRPAPRTDPAAAAVWGFVRTAQTENPGRFTLVDTDGVPASLARVAAAAATGEAQLKIRDGQVSVPHLVHAPDPGTAPGHDADGTPSALGTGTVLITGGTGGLGAKLARHLVARHGTRRLLLTSRRGPAAPEAAALRDELTDAGAHVDVVACDVTSRDSVAALIGAVPAEHPLTAVIHCAGVLDDGVVQTLTEDRVNLVLAPKVRGAWHLHELTAHLDLSAFVLFSSVASVLGTAGQANYAAANAFLDGLAETRRAAGLAATALCWGFWAERSEMVAGLVDTDLARLRRQGVLPMSSQEGLALFDAALTLDEPVLVPARLNLPASDAASPLLRGLSGAPGAPGGPADPNAAAGPLAQRLVSLPPHEARAALLTAVREQTALVLGHPDTGRISPTAAFRQLGIDSLTALELRNKLVSVTGLKLPTTLVFDHPTPSALAGFLSESLAPGPAAGPRHRPASWPRRSKDWAPVWRTRSSTWRARTRRPSPRCSANCRDGSARWRAPRHRPASPTRSPRHRRASFSRCWTKSSARGER
ncbi:type I polyketide synthase [Streptomyces erythrogriseus]